MGGCSSSSGGSSGASSGDGGGTGTQGSAQVRFRYKAEWKDHLGACPSISDYRIGFGAIPTPINVSIDATPDSLGQYIGLEGRTYKDADVLHTFSCNQSQTSKSTMQLYSRFGTDLALVASKRYTVTLGGTAATLTEDP